MPSEEHNNMLLQEYGYCDEQIGRLDSLIWQTASIIYPISLAGFTYFGSSSSTHTIDTFMTVIAVGIGSIVLLTVWYLLSRLWFRYQSIAYYRMTEIEDELGAIWRFRYSSFLSKSKSKRLLSIENMDKEERSRFEKLNSRIGDFEGFGQRRAITFVTLMFILGWVVIIIRELLLTFHL